MLACCDLGLQKNGTRRGPKAIAEYFKAYQSRTLQQNDIRKSLAKDDKRKNLKELVSYSHELYDLFNQEYEKGNEPVLIGGDHSLAIPSILASSNYHDDLGLIWIDAHTDYHTLATTITGNLHGCPCACVDGYHNEELRSYHKGKTIDPKKTVIFGARSIDMPEYSNIKEAGVKVITSEDIFNKGIDCCFKEALAVLGPKFHVSFDLDFLDPEYAPGVSVPECHGPKDKELESLLKMLKENRESIASLDLVEYNPDLDIDNRTLAIAIRILEDLL